MVLSLGRSNPLRFLFVGVSLLFFVVALFVISNEKAFAAPPAGSTWVQTFNDDFNGTSVDTTKWDTASWGIPANSSELQGYKAANNVVSGGTLKQIVKEETFSYGGKTVNYSSGFMTTEDKFNQRFGYFEARMKLPKGSGMWPAFWMVAASNHPSPTGGTVWPPEIDILEGFNPDNGELHEYLANNFQGPNFPISGGGSSGITSQLINFLTADITAGFHNYAVEWDGTKMRFYYDDVQVGSDVTTQVNWNEGMYMILNLAICPGGINGCNPPNAQTVFPAQLEVDYVRVYSKSGSGNLSIEGNGTGFPIYGDNVDYNLGTVFYTTQNGNVTGLRVYGASGESGDHQAYLFNNSCACTTNLGVWNYNGNNTWITKSISPVAITTGYDYTVSISTGTDTNRKYAVDLGGFGGGGTVNNVLYWYAGSGVYGPKGSSRPTNVYQNHNYLRDILFQPN